jgi:hypothetical protein
MSVNNGRNEFIKSAADPGPLQLRRPLVQDRRHQNSERRDGNLMRISASNLSLIYNLLVIDFRIRVGHMSL